MNKDYYNKWYQIEEFPNGPYEINKMGQIRNKRTKNILKPQIKNAGYLVYTLYIDRKIYYRQAHILVARQFIPNPDNKPIVNHKDENKMNPCVDNLEWVTEIENANYGTSKKRGAKGKSDIEDINRIVCKSKRAYHGMYTGNSSMLICVTNGDTNSSKRSVAMKNEIVLAGKLIEIIEASRNNALRKVNEELIRMYWSVGEYLSAESKNVVFGDKYIDTIAKEIQVMFPGIKGFNRRGLYRMKQFYELYKDNPTVSPLVTQISWTNHLLIMSGCKSDEEREFYIKLCIKESYSKRELERQIDSGYYESWMLSTIEKNIRISLR